MKNEIKYQYALDYNSDRIVNVNSINDKNRHNDYRCISCNNKLFPRLGDINVHHFAHFNGCDCNSETYLHNLAKLSLYNNLKNKLEKKIPLMYYVYYYDECNVPEGFNCVELAKKEKLDLFDYYSKVCLETKIEGFVPDVCLCSSDKTGPIFFEIKVTHGCELRKIYSDNRIIEFEVCDENDAIQLGHLESIDINSNNYKLTSYNFKDHYRKVDLSKTCEKISYFVVLHNGMALTLDNKAIKRYNPDAFIYFYKNSCFGKDKTFSELMRQCIQNNVEVKSCYLCKYRNCNHRGCVCNLKGKTKKQCGGYFTEQDIEDKRVKQSAAVKCEKYRVDSA